MSIFINTILLLLSLSFSNNSSDKDNLILRFTNVSAPSGTLSIGIYDDADKFCKENEFIFANDFTVDKTGIIDIKIPEFPHGTYAVAMYHDVNGNGEMDKNLVGIPKEPYAFSNNVNAKWSEPSFEEAQFTFDTQNRIFEIEILEWADH